VGRVHVGCGEHDDGEVRPRLSVLETTADLEPVHLGEVEVEDDEVEALLGGPLQRGLTAGHADHLEPFGPEVALEDLQHEGIVVHRQHPARAHGATSCAAEAGSSARATPGAPTSSATR
jgi:hypothetical protein